MTVSDLIKELQYVLDDYGDLDVRVAYQPEWPLAGKIVNVWVQDQDESKPVWLAVDGVCRSESPYAPKDAW